MSYLGSHGGAAGESIAVTEAGEEVLSNEEFDNSDNLPARKYVRITAAPTNAGIIYLLLNKTGPAVVGKGIPLVAGAVYEINFTNLYQGPIFAITPAAETGTLCVQSGY